MTSSNLRSAVCKRKRPDHDNPEYRRMRSARDAFCEAMHDWLHRADAREGQIEVTGTIRLVQEIATVVDPRIVPGIRP